MDVPVLCQIVTSYKSLESLLAFLSQIEDHWFEIFHIFVKLVWPRSFYRQFNFLNIWFVMSLHEINSITPCWCWTSSQRHLEFVCHGVAYSWRTIKQFKCKNCLNRWLVHVLWTVFAQVETSQVNIKIMIVLEYAKLRLMAWNLSNFVLRDNFIETLSEAKTSLFESNHVMLKLVLHDSKALICILVFFLIAIPINVEELI